MNITQLAIQMESEDTAENQQYREDIIREQNCFESEARKIVESKRDHSGWKRYMNAECKIVDDCTSPMCPLDIRLSHKEKQDALMCCEIENRKPIAVYEEQGEDRYEKAIMTELNVTETSDYVASENSCSN